MELFTVFLVMYMVKIVAEDTYHGVKGTPNPRHAARARRQKARAKSRTWGAVSNYWADLVEDATQAATENRRRKAAERRQQREEKPDDEIQDAEFWESGEEPLDPWKEATPAAKPRCWCGKPSADPTGHLADWPPCDYHSKTRSEATSPASEPDSNVYKFPNQPKENDMSDTTIEVQGLDQAVTYAQSIAEQAAQHGTAGNEGYIAHLTEHEVSGDALASAHAMQEAFAAAAEAAEQHAADLERGRVVQEAYDVAPDAGDKEFATGGR